MSEDIRKFTCRDCGQHIEAPVALVGTELDCPGCQRRIRLRVKDSDAPSQPSKVSARAFNLAVMAAVALFLAVVLAGIGAINALDEKPYAGDLIAAGALLILAFWLKLLEQLFHIRAALERAK